MGGEGETKKGGDKKGTPLACPFSFPFFPPRAEEAAADVPGLLCFTLCGPLQTSFWNPSITSR